MKPILYVIKNPHPYYQMVSNTLPPKNSFKGEIWINYEYLYSEIPLLPLNKRDDLLKYNPKLIGPFWTKTRRL